MCDGWTRKKNSETIEKQNGHSPRTAACSTPLHSVYRWFACLLPRGWLPAFCRCKCIYVTLILPQLLIHYFCIQMMLISGSNIIFFFEKANKKTKNRFCGVVRRIWSIRRLNEEIKDVKHFTFLTIILDPQLKFDKHETNSKTVKTNLSFFSLIQHWINFAAAQLFMHSFIFSQFVIFYDSMGVSITIYN